jgi:hypothetical protein
MAIHLVRILIGRSFLDVNGLWFLDELFDGRPPGPARGALGRGRSDAERGEI